ncbi:MAG: hypothetical protein NWE75_07515 [Candidatus Bathyarchaeota archaeon]|nr:hypothetical protein [Candidatus Bathyarchaeota archaeon]
MNFYELLVTSILIAPLLLTILVLAFSFLGTGLRELVNLLKERRRVAKAPPTDEDHPESELDMYIDDLKKRKEQHATV